ncbi:MAG: family 1 glycosylhydrolase [Lewinellaceae bacterium]|nr:family 1 glycosylhydrolase [Lewinellaceae bacterium]
MLPKNGVATTDETFRIRYLEAHLQEVQRAMAEGAQVKGYMVWSLTDNFEWQHGFSKRFGLIHIDYATQKREIKKAGHWFAEVISQNRLPG